ncbi:hypothetical protein JTB14_029249 [Gonioctena quinquepunctata]|nr:hypothetical protein JTB14_029249 [Gonioctena quinquepunctata]
MPRTRKVRRNDYGCHLGECHLDPIFAEYIRLLDVPESGTLPVEYMDIHAVTAPTAVDETEQWEDFMDIDNRNEQFSDSDMADVILCGVKRLSENNCSGHGPSIETT